MTTTDPVVHDVDARRWRVLGYALLALLAYVPVLLTKPGKVVADTKSYLYLDPGRLLERAASMWDPNIGMGTVTHQNIGYLFPMGPYYWLMHELGVPAWVSQRLWFGSLLLAAAVGVLFLMRTLRVRGPGAVVAAVLFMLSPYTLDFAARISVILMPWAGLPWMLALTIRALRARDGRGAWRYAAIFALVVQIVGGVNATALGVRGDRAGAVDPLRGRDPRGRLATRARRDRAHRRADRGHVVVVDRRSLGAGQVRAQHPEVHRDPAGGVVGVDAARDPARPRVLVLLRHRSHRPLDRRQRPVHAEPRRSWW